METLFNMTTGIYKTMDRLAHYRKEAAESPNPHCRDWRFFARRSLWQTPSNSRGKGGRIFSESLDQYGDVIGDAHEIIRLDHTGYYCDHFYSGVIKGAVVRLRCPKGTMYIPATYCTEWDGTTHYIGDAGLVPKGSPEEDHEEAKRQAARDADHYAEREAEESREDFAKGQAEGDIISARSNIHEINRKALALIREIKKAGSFTPTVCSALREKLADYMAERASQFRIIDAREANFWSAVEN